MNDKLIQIENDCKLLTKSKEEDLSSIQEYRENLKKDIKNLGKLFDIVVNNAYKLGETDKIILSDIIAKSKVNNAHSSIVEYINETKKYINDYETLLAEFLELKEEFIKFLKNVEIKENYINYTKTVIDFNERAEALISDLKKIKSNGNPMQQIEQVLKEIKSKSLLSQINSKFDISSMKYSASTNLDKDFLEASKITIAN